MRILKNISALVAGILLTVSSLNAGTATLTGNFRSPTGAQFNGFIRFSLPFAGAVDTTCDGGGSCLAVPLVTQVAIINGQFTTLYTPRLIRNGDITPAGTYYRAAVYSTSGALISSSALVIPAGVSSFDVGAALQTAITTNNVSYITPASLSGNNTWTGTNTFNGPVVFNSTITGLTLPCSSAAAANTVCGNNTGAPANPAFVKLTFSMTDGTTIAPLASPTFTGTPAAPTPPTGDFSTRIATTAFVQSTLQLTGQTFNRVTLGAPVNIAASPSTTNVMSQAVTMPSTGCPCRALVQYGVNADTANSGEMTATINDGTNNWGTSSMNTTGAATDFPISGGGISTGTYANNATITFTMKASQNMGGTPAIHVNNATGVGGPSWMTILVITSN